MDQTRFAVPAPRLGDSNGKLLSVGDKVLARDNRSGHIKQSVVNRIGADGVVKVMLADEEHGMRVNDSKDLTKYDETVEPVPPMWPDLNKRGSRAFDINNAKHRINGVLSEHIAAKTAAHDVAQAQMDRHSAGSKKHVQAQHELFIAKGALVAAKVAERKINYLQDMFHEHIKRGGNAADTEHHENMRGILDSTLEYDRVLRDHGVDLPSFKDKHYTEALYTDTIPQRLEAQDNLLKHLADSKHKFGHYEGIRGMFGNHRGPLYVHTDVLTAAHDRYLNAHHALSPELFSYARHLGAATNLSRLPMPPHGWAH